MSDVGKLFFYILALPMLPIIAIYLAFTGYLKVNTKPDTQQKESQIQEKTTETVSQTTEVHQTVDSNNENWSLFIDFIKAFAIFLVLYMIQKFVFVFSKLFI